MTASPFSSRSTSPLSLPSPRSVPATPGVTWSPRPGMSSGLPNGSLPGSTAVSPSWSPAQGSLILGEASPRPSSGELLDDDELERQYSEAVAKCTVNPRYYFDDDQISFFKVENQKFKVHRHFLVRDSVYFQELFAGPLGEFGAKESEAIPLEGIGSAEFECLLDFFYTGMYRQSTFSLSQWVTLLSISTRLRFDLLRAHAIQSIEESPIALDPIDKLVLAMKYKIHTWLAPAYTALCQRTNCLEEWEAEKIGLKKTVQIARAREVYREAQLQAVCRSPSVPSPVYCWRPTQSSLTPECDLNEARAARIVDEVFFS